MGLFSFFKKKDKKTETVEQKLAQEDQILDNKTEQDDGHVENHNADETDTADVSDKQALDSEESVKSSDESAASENSESLDGSKSETTDEIRSDLNIKTEDVNSDTDLTSKSSQADNFISSDEIKADEADTADTAQIDATDSLESVSIQEQGTVTNDDEIKEDTALEATPDEKDEALDKSEKVLDTDTTDNVAADDLRADSIDKKSDDVDTDEQSVAPLVLFSSAEDERSDLDKAKEQLNDTSAVVESESEVKESFFSRLKRTRDSLAFGISSLIKGRKIDDDLYEELETALLTADIGIDTTNEIIDKLKEESRIKELHDASLLKKNLHKTLCKILEPCALPLNIETDKKPFVILMVGVNGAGKTTTIGKLAQKYKESGKKVMLAAGDTFRAAAVEQLKEWGKRIDVPVVAQQTGSDSASVLYDALNSARAKDIDVLICDTAGRLQNKENLMDELKKIVRVMKKIDEDVPQEVMLVLDAATGQNAVSQAKLFSEAVKVSGITLTKLDGTAKGGIIFALADKFKIPIRYVGIGEKAKDLREFSVDPFVEALLREDK